MSLIFAVAAAENQRAVLAGGIDRAGLIAEKNAERVTAAHANHHIANGVERTFARLHAALAASA